MAMKICKDCGTEVSKSAKTCPKCGKKLKHSGIRIVLGIIIILIGIGALSSTLENIDSTSSNTISQGKQSTTVNKENYNKINKGMSEQQVEEILGESESVGESETPGIGTMIMKHYQEPLTFKAIDVTFLNGKVYTKNWTEL